MSNAEAPGPEQAARATSGEPMPSLPAGARLAPGERPLLSARFRYGTLAFHLHTELVLTDRRLYATHPNTLLGLVGIGVSRGAVPVERIASIGSSSHLSIPAILLTAVAGWLAIIGFSTPDQAAYGAIWLVFAAVLALWVPRQSIRVRTGGGGVVDLWVSILERGRATEFADRLSEAIINVRAGSPRSPGVPEPFPGARPEDSIEAMTQLNRLRELELISPEEFDAKRTEIIRRL